MADARVERRLAAILAADVAGYSRLMGVDEEGTLAALKACRREFIDPKIAEHRAARYYACEVPSVIRPPGTRRFQRVPPDYAHFLSRGRAPRLLE